MCSDDHRGGAYLEGLRARQDTTASEGPQVTYEKKPEVVVTGSSTPGQASVEPSSRTSDRASMNLLSAFLGCPDQLCGTSRFGTW